MKLEWTKKKILQAVYWGIFVLMLLVAVLVFRQDGIYLETNFQSKFYKLESATEQQRVFNSGEVQLVQTGFFPESESVTIEISQYEAAPLVWTLTQKDKNALLLSNGTQSLTGSYRVNDLGATFYFDDMEQYLDDLYANYNESVGISQRFLSQECISGFVRLAYGQTDNFGRYSLEMFFPWILIVVLAYVIGFHAEALFEWKKAWSFEFRNAEQLEPSEWYFVSSYLSAAVLWVTALFIYLLMIGLIE